MEFRNQLIIGISIIIGWVPSLILVALACLGVFLGALSLFDKAFPMAIAFVTLGVMGILGFVGSTSVCWGLKISYRKRFWFLLCGVASLLVASLWLFNGSYNQPNLHDDAAAYLFFYIFICPLLIGIFHVVLHLKSVGKVT
ncbi:hypothetical protein [Pseudoalteromonas sp. PPB1]|uniref:hypothetical protein n=1 Tax=Pseudoalteromonas sp. PPB1 TaxID=2756136 RepID=UPI001891CF91|nr:hypothetical protein [Pseudoalteromonas sp. PPB1]